MCLIDTAQRPSYSLEILSLLRYMHLALCLQCIHDRFQLTALLLRHLQQNSKLLQLHRHIHIITYKFIYNLFSLLKCLVHLLS